MIIVDCDTNIPVPLTVLSSLLTQPNLDPQLEDIPALLQLNLHFSVY